jgi:hypothetical protein
LFSIYRRTYRHYVESKIISINNNPIDTVTDIATFAWLIMVEPTSQITQLLATHYQTEMAQHHTNRETNCLCIHEELLKESPYERFFNDYYTPEHI